ncbi:MAG: alpha/beta fold hydrolase [Rhodocyclaceae bacterium]
MLASALRFFLLIELAIYMAMAMRVFDLDVLPAIVATLAVLLGQRAGIIATTYAVAVAHHSPAPPLGWLRAVRMVLAEYFAFLRLFLVVQPWERLWMGEDRLQPHGGRLLLLIHGYGCNRAAWWWLRHRLEAAGFLVATVNLEPLYVDIDHYVTAIDTRIEAACQAACCDRLTLVGHSMGGLAARAYLERHGVARVDQLVTLATPHAGSVLARMGMGANARQMEPGSSWLKSLWLHHPDLPMVALRNSHDNFVIPQDNQRFPGALDIELSGVGHLAMLFSARTEKALLAALQR